MSTQAPEGTQSGLVVGVSQILDAYERMEMPVRRYLLLIVLPATALFVGTIIAAVYAPLSRLFRIPLPALGLLGLFAAIVYPKLQQDRRRAEIGDYLHLFITHMTILSTTNIDRVEVFRTLANEREYGALADEMRKIVELVDTWNQSLDDACRRRAKEIPDEDLSDFLERMAYILNAGQDLDDFLMSEQDAIIRSYVTHYRSSLDNLDVLKDLYLSMVLSMTFALVFATVLPILTGTDPTMLVAVVLVMFLFIQIGFAYAISVLTPNDPIWYTDTTKRKPFNTRLLVALVAGLVMSVLLVLVGLASAVGVWPFGAVLPAVHEQIPMAFYIAIPTTPLLVPGLVMRREEKRIRERDEEFASFIRSLGSTESVKQSTTEKVLADLKTRDFGPLTEPVENLYRRLNIRIDIQLAWDHFIAESRSYLIQKFSEMYVVGREMGGDPKVLGELISHNMNEVLQLREQRSQSTITFIGLLYGITAASAFAFFIGIEVVEVLSGLSVGLETPEFDVGSFIYPGVYDIPVIRYLLLLIILSNAGLSALMARIVDDGHFANTFLHFVLLTWLGATIAWVTGTMVESFLAVG